MLVEQDIAKSQRQLQTITSQRDTLRGKLEIYVHQGIVLILISLIYIYIIIYIDI